MEIEDKEFLTVGEAMAYLGSSRTFLYNLCDQGQLNKYHVNRRVYFKRKELVDLIQNSL
jgi:excisionase family DNA binding protein